MGRRAGSWWKAPRCREVIAAQQCLSCLSGALSGAAFRCRHSPQGHRGCTNDSRAHQMLTLPQILPPLTHKTAPPPALHRKLPDDVFFLERLGPSGAVCVFKVYYTCRGKRAVHSNTLPGWAPDPLLVGIRSPDGLGVGSCTSHPGVLGSIPKREEPGKTGRHPVLKYRVPHGSQKP
jgi:hypothetical protein